MNTSTKTLDSAGGNLHFVKRRLTNGKVGYGAEINWNSQEKILIDHWNLGALKRQVNELLPIMKMAREVNR